MKLILRENVKGTGTAGEIIEVKPGFARNYLIPRGLAYMATNSNIKIFDFEKHQKMKKVELQFVEAEKKKAELEKVSLTTTVKVSEDGRLFGSVTQQNISDLLKEKGYDINHRKIILDEPIKELGVYEVGISLAPGIEALIKVWVVKE
ncbi:MAG: 50S ribosomal protein L9 [Candidatus Latescibacter sp.]|nr:50S ribosomal protein L9 [Candidatus Latescibacter sp.]